MNTTSSERMNISQCRACDSTNLVLYLPLGDQALANRFLRPEDVNQPEPKFPLEVFYCGDCFHSQLGYTVPPEVMFREYLYVSSTSDAIPVHFAEYAKEMYERFMQPGDMVVEIASNDGCLLKGFRPYDVKILGVEPALNIAKIAREQGIETVSEFFTKELVHNTLIPKYGHAKAVISNNVFAHVNNIADFTDAGRELLADDGVWAIESPHILTMLKNNEFDTVYHEHISYLSLYALTPFFKRHGLNMFDVKPTAVHGGSNRMYLCKDLNKPMSEGLHKLLQEEIDYGINKPETYTVFHQRVEKVKESLMKLLRDLKAQGKTICGYGASAKGQTLVQYFGIGTDILEYIADKSPLKQDRLSPGMHIPVVSPDKIKRSPTDYMLLLAWNFGDEIMRQQEEYKNRGGKFILPIPNPRIIE
ncbi:MAG: methyltransferase domain-containing protein [Candidatus Kerfeldbacteria bacterium]|nr:methyltransferase domain-containing protein [Candidatus Kerfeldbacteria bacterium]